MLETPARSGFRTGFVGLGLMGKSLAGRALDAGHAVSLLQSSRNSAAVAPLLARGAAVMATPAALARACDVVVLCVTGAPDVEAVVFGPQGLLTAGKGVRVIDCSTSLPDMTQRCHAALRELGGAFIDAAMTGTPSDAEAGTLNLLLGGEAGELERLAPLMRCWARNLYHCGPTGAGHSVKLLHQFVVLSNAAVLAEAFSVARLCGADARVLGEVIASGGANSMAFQRLRPYVEEKRDDMFRFTLSNALKDMHYYSSMARSAGGCQRLSEASLWAYTRANEMGLGSEFVPHLLDAADQENRKVPTPSP